MKILDGAWKISMLVVLSAGIYLTACTKKAQLIGLGVRPIGDIEVNFTDTSSIVAFSVLQDSIVTTNYGRFLLGSMIDPVLGKTTANYYSQLSIQTDNDFNFGQNAVVDSLILSLSYDGSYGDTNTMQTLRVYELSEKIISDSGYYYYSNDQISHYGTEIGRITFQPQPNTPSLIEGDSIDPQIRINLMELTDVFGNKLISAPLEALQNNENFGDYIYGFCIVTDPVDQGGAMLYFNILSTYSNLTLYYSNDSISGISHPMNLYDSTKRFNQYDHNNYLDASPEFKSQVLEGEATLGQEQIYVQALGGVVTKITFPFIKNMASLGNLAINSAELIFTGVEENTGNAAPDRLTLVEINPDGTESDPIIDIYEGEDYYGGFYDSTNNQYKFQIARYIQQLITKDTIDYGIYLRIYGGFTNGGQYILNGTNPSLPTPYSDRLKLKITYSIIE